MPPAIPPALRDAVLDALALLLPVDCAGCGAEGRALCEECRAALRPAPARRPLRPERPDSPPVVAGLVYAGPARRAVLALKDGGRPGLARALAPALSAAAREAAALLGPGDGLVLCPIPSARAALRRRGYAPVALLARAAGLRTTALLVADRAARPQKGLGAATRERNARFAPRRPARVRGLEVVLLDDVVTTGATLRAAARALEAHGARLRGAVVLAATPRRGAGGGRPGPDAQEIPVANPAEVG